MTFTEPSMEFSTGTMPLLRLAALDSGDHPGDRVDGDELAARELRLREQRLLGEGTRRAEKGDASHGAMIGRTRRVSPSTPSTRTRLP